MTRLTPEEYRARFKAAHPHYQRDYWRKTHSTGNRNRAIRSPKRIVEAAMRSDTARRVPCYWEYWK